MGSEPTAHDAILAGFLGFVHGFVGAFDHDGLIFARGDLGHPRAEGDQGLPVIVHKDFAASALAATGSKALIASSNPVSGIK